jgi:hypothetical protein
MTMDGKMFYFTNSAAIRQLLELFLIWVTKRCSDVIRSTVDIFIVVETENKYERNEKLECL